MNFQSAANLSIRTKEGDIVNLSVNHERSYSESASEMRGSDGSVIRKFSMEATAMSKYSLSVQGDLNEEEMSAILGLVKSIGPMMREFFSGDKPVQGGEGAVALELPEEIQAFRLSMEQTFSAVVSTSSLSNNDPEDSGIRDMRALISAVMDSVLMSIVSGNENDDSDVLLKFVNLLGFVIPHASSQN